jgi:hypothetical protein
MRKFAAVGAVFLAGCSTVSTNAGSNAVCDATGSGRFVGQAGTSETGAAILAATHASTLRWARPGMMMTMEFNASRVTVRLGPDGKIAAIHCG